MTDSQSKLYKLTITPSGKKLYAYMGAILEVTGMINGEIFPLKKFLGNFKTHLDNGRIIRDGSGFKLTPEGKDYFLDRFNPNNPQHITRQEVDVMVKGIKNGQSGEDWTCLDR